MSICPYVTKFVFTIHRRLFWARSHRFARKPCGHPGDPHELIARNSRFQCLLLQRVTSTPTSTLPSSCIPLRQGLPLAQIWAQRLRWKAFQCIALLSISASVPVTQKTLLRLEQSKLWLLGNSWGTLVIKNDTTLILVCPILAFWAIDPLCRKI